MTRNELNTTIDFLTNLLREAGEIMTAAGEKAAAHGIAADAKPGTANYVTAYDVAVQSFLMERITERLPHAVFIAEEKENDPSVMTEELCFVIDPIDGTTNFIHDYRHSCISLGLISEGATVFGAIYDPYLDEMFTATRGEGAYLNGVRLTVSDREMSEAVTAFGTCPYYKDTVARANFAFAEELFYATADLRRCGSAALDLAYLAAGRNDIFFEFRLSPWDFAAGALLVEEAGGIITRKDGRPMKAGLPCSCLAANPRIYPTLLEMAKKYCD